MITESPYAATATALTAICAYRLDKAAIAAAMAQMPALRDGLAAAAELGQLASQRDATAPESQVPPHPEMFLAKLRSFFRLLVHE